MRNILFIGLLLCTLISYGQRYTKALDKIKSGNYEKAEKFLSRAQKKMPAFARYGQAVLYAQSDYSGHSILRAYRYANYALNYYRRSDNKESLQNQFRINKTTIRQMIDSLALQAYYDIPEKQNERALTKYLDIYSESPIYEKVQTTRDSLAFETARKKGHFRDYQSFVRQYPDASQVPDAQAKFEQLWKQIYENALQTGEALALDYFKNKYRDFPFYDEYGQNHEILAQRGQNLSFEKGFFEQLAPKYEKFIKDAAPKDIAFVALQLIIRKDINDKNFDNALDSLEKYTPYFAENPKRINELQTLLTAESSFKAKPQALEGQINTKGWEYSASATADDRQMVFCGRNRSDNLKSGLEDIFISHKKNGIWQAGRPVDELNTEKYNEAPLSVSADGTRMLLFSEGNIYYSDKTSRGWGEKKVFPKINRHEAWEADALMTADGNAVFFISDRKGNQGIPVKFGKRYHGGRAGNTDIYVSIKKQGEWSDPINIGDSINTPYSERSPFLHPDMKTLYFSSDGHTGLGQKDVFVSKRLSDTCWTCWSKPVNLGKSINTSDDEWGYKISGDGKKAYFSRFDGQSFNIYYTQLPPEHRPETTTRIFGTVKNTKGEILQSEIVWENLETQKEVGQSNSDPENGQYIITLPNGKNYGFFVETPGYYPVSGNIDLREVNTMQEIEKNFILKSVEEITEGDESIPLENIFFEFNSAKLKEESYPELNRFARFIKSHSKKTIEISGHTDSKGSDEYNKNLSLRRAESVKKYLISQGCNAEKLTVKGYGSEKPIADNSTEEGRAKNRRVEFKVLKTDN